MNATPVFDDAEAKIKRAWKHVSELEGVITSHIATHPVVWVDVPQDPTSNVKRGRFTTPPGPPDTSVIIGDVIHNLRASLDLMANAMAEANTGRKVNNVYFPFGFDLNGFIEQINKKRFHFCGLDAVAHIKTLRPYKNGNIELRAIHDLDLLDKHKALIPVPQVGVQLNIDFETGKALSTNSHNYSFAYPQETNLGEREIIQTTKQLVQLCESILVSFAALKFG